MKKEIKIYLLITIMIFACNISVNAQQKLSDKDFTEVMKKVNEKRSARYAYISRMKASLPTENNGANPANPGVNPQVGTGVNAVPAPPGQVSPNLKLSQQPMRIPKKPVISN